MRLAFLCWSLWPTYFSMWKSTLLAIAQPMKSFLRAGRARDQQTEWDWVSFYSASRPQRARLSWWFIFSALSLEVQAPCYILQPYSASIKYSFASFQAPVWEVSPDSGLPLTLPYWICIHLQKYFAANPWLISCKGSSYTVPRLSPTHRSCESPLSYGGAI